jgi:hypothetical protein
MERNNDLKILFCHIPKCAGTNVNFCLQKKLNSCYEWYVHRILQYEMEKYKNYYKFSVVRDPIERLVSLYFYQTNFIKELIRRNMLNYQEGNWQKVHDLYKKYNITDIYSFLKNFKTFYENEIQQFIPELNNLQKQQNMAIFFAVGYLPQYLFICDDNFSILVNDLINIKDVDSFLTNKFNIKSQTKVNTHKNSNDCYKDYITEENKKDIMNIYHQDYTLFSHLFQ